MSSWSLESDVISAAFRWRLSWHPSLWASLFLETFFSWHSLLSTSHTLDTVFAWHNFSCFLLLHFYFETSLCQNCFLWHLLSWHLLCLEAVFHSHISVFWHFRTLRTKFILWILCNTRLAQSPSCTKKPVQRISQELYTWYYKACTKYFPVLLRTTKRAPSTSQYYFVLQSLHMPALSISNLSTSLPSPSLISPHPHSHQLCSCIFYGWDFILLWLFNCCDYLLLWLFMSSSWPYFPHNRG